MRMNEKKRQKGDRTCHKYKSERKQGGSMTVYLDGKLRYGAFQLPQKEMGLERWVVLRKK